MHLDFLQTFVGLSLAPESDNRILEKLFRSMKIIVSTYDFQLLKTQMIVFMTISKVNLTLSVLSVVVPALVSASSFSTSSLCFCW